MKSVDELPEPGRLDYERLHDAIAALAARVAGGRLGGGLAAIALAGPDLAVYAARLLRDERVPRRTRGDIIGSVIFLASPFELVPVALFGPAGLVDDAFVAARLFDVLLNKVDPEVARDLWPGDRVTLERLQAIAAGGRKLFGAGLRQGVRLLFRRGAREVGRAIRDAAATLPLRLLGPAAPG